MKHIFLPYPKNVESLILKLAIVPFIDLNTQEARLLNEMHRLVNSLDNGQFQRPKEYLTKGILHLLAESYQRMESKVIKLPAILMQLHELIEKHYCSERRCRFYAAVIGVTTKTLNTTAKRTTGKVVEVMIMDRLSIAAEELLNTSNLPIKHIAYELGFADQSHFNRFFRKYYNVSPLAFRLQCLQNTTKTA